MRAALVNAWPALAEFGITPLTYDQFAEVEIEACLDALEARRRAQEKQAKQAKKRPAARRRR